MKKVKVFGLDGKEIKRKKIELKELENHDIEIEEKELEKVEVKREQVETSQNLSSKLQTDGFEIRVLEEKEVEEHHDINLKDLILDKLDKLGLDKSLIEEFVARNQYDVDLNKGFYNSDEEAKFIYNVEKMKNQYDGAQNNEPFFDVPKPKEMYVAPKQDYPNQFDDKEMSVKPVEWSPSKPQKSNLRRD